MSLALGLPSKPWEPLVLLCWVFVPYFLGAGFSGLDMSVTFLGNGKMLGREARRILGP